MCVSVFVRLLVWADAFVLRGRTTVPMQSERSRQVGASFLSSRCHFPVYRHACPFTLILNGLPTSTSHVGASSESVALFLPFLLGSMCLLLFNGYLVACGYNTSLGRGRFANFLEDHPRRCLMHTRCACLTRMSK